MVFSVQEELQIRAPDINLPGKKVLLDPDVVKLYFQDASNST